MFYIIAGVVLCYVAALLFGRRLADAIAAWILRRRMTGRDGAITPEGILWSKGVSPEEMALVGKALDAHGERRASTGPATDHPWLTDGRLKDLLRDYHRIVIGDCVLLDETCVQAGPVTIDGDTYVRIGALKTDDDDDEFLVAKDGSILVRDRGEPGALETMSANIDKFIAFIYLSRQ